MSRASFEVLGASTERIVLRDCGGPVSRSVTNDAENVIGWLVRTGRVVPGTRVYYFDSENEPGELCHDGARFTGFAEWDGVR